MNFSTSDQNAAAPSFLRTLGEGSIVLTAGNIILKSATILSTIVVLRFIDIYDYGVWRLILGAVGIFGILTFPGIETVLIADLSRELGRKREDIYRSIFSQSSVLFFSIGCISGLFLFVSAPAVSAFSGLNITEPLRILSFSFVLLALQRIYMLAFYSYLQFWQAQAVKILSRVAYLGLLIVFVWFGVSGVMSITYAYVLSTVVPLAVLMPFFLSTARRFFSHAERVSFSLWSVVKTHGKWALLNNYFDDLVGSARPWILGAFLGVEAVAILSVAQSIFGELTNVVPLAQILNPLAPREVDHATRFRLLFERGMKYALWLYVAIGIIAFFAIPPVVAVLFPKYISSIPYFLAILPVLAIYPFGSISVNAFYALKAQRELFFSSFSVRIITIPVFLPLFLAVFGIWGAVIEFILTAVLIAFIRIRYMKTLIAHLRIKLQDLLYFDARDLFVFKNFMRQARHFFS